MLKVSGQPLPCSNRLPTTKSNRRLPRSRQPRLKVARPRSTPSPRPKRLLAHQPAFLSLKVVAATDCCKGTQ